MIEIIPAIDIIDGKCVRLSQGDYDSKKVYNENPVEVAREFEANGVRRLHVVDLDGAASHHVVNHRVLEQIATCTSLIVDFGGGVKSDEDLKIAFESGAQMVTGGRIDRDLIRSGIQQAIYIAQFIDATAHGKRDIDIGSNPLYQFRESLTSFMTCGNIQKHKFICSLFAVSPPQLYRITGLAQIDKVRSFYGLSVFYIQTGYDSFC